MSPKYKQLNLEGLEENMDTKVADEKIVAELMKPELPYVKHIIQGINKRNAYGVDGDVPTHVIEGILEEYHQKGYKLFHVELLTPQPPGQPGSDFFQMLYVLVRE